MSIILLHAIAPCKSDCELIIEVLPDGSLNPVVFTNDRSYMQTFVASLKAIEQVCVCDPLDIGDVCDDVQEDWDNKDFWLKLVEQVRAEK